MLVLVDNWPISQTTHALPALQPAGASEQAGRPLGALPPWLLPRVLATQVFASAREVSQVAANEYLDNAGISPHVEDDPTAFGPNLATLSLLSPVHLTLIPTSEPPLDQCGVDHGNWVKVLLEPRSLFVLQGESRYDYRHGIRRSRSVPLPGGTVLRRGSGYRRVSLTFRELLATRRQLEEDCVHGPTDGRGRYRWNVKNNDWCYQCAAPLVEFPALERKPTGKWLFGPPALAIADSPFNEQVQAPDAGVAAASGVYFGGEGKGTSGWVAHPPPEPDVSVFLRSKFGEGAGHVGLLKSLDEALAAKAAYPAPAKPVKPPLLEAEAHAKGVAARKAQDRLDICALRVLEGDEWLRQAREDEAAAAKAASETTLGWQQACAKHVPKAAATTAPATSSISLSTLLVAEGDVQELAVIEGPALDISGLELSDTERAERERVKRGLASEVQNAVSTALAATRQKFATLTSEAAAVHERLKASRRRGGTGEAADGAAPAAETATADGGVSKPAGPEADFLSPAEELAHDGEFLIKASGAFIWAAPLCRGVAYPVFGACSQMGAFFGAARARDSFVEWRGQGALDRLSMSISRAKVLPPCISSSTRLTPSTRKLGHDFTFHQKVALQPSKAPSMPYLRGLISLRSGMCKTARDKSAEGPLIKYALVEAGTEGNFELRGGAFKKQWRRRLQLAQPLPRVSRPEKKTSAASERPKQRVETMAKCRAASPDEALRLEFDALHDEKQHTDAAAYAQCFEIPADSWPATAGRFPARAGGEYLRFRHLLGQVNSEGLDRVAASSASWVSKTEDAMTSHHRLP
ncbi:unnamed protein product [Prorocentrum cordatum]|uniref:Alpha-ketoglutarate-dependent dioxygenase AlkB-like domain-containing protein n=1 Tax=Prorocentrum cordatum TaxID=2364126 RepID=A0ABN9W1H4_9DINO|nr:unnamed protein product [Polarella glacialis]